MGSDSALGCGCTVEGAAPESQNGDQSGREKGQCPGLELQLAGTVELESTAGRSSISRRPVLSIPGVKGSASPSGSLVVRKSSEVIDLMGGEAASPAEVESWPLEVES